MIKLSLVVSSDSDFHQNFQHVADYIVFEASWSEEIIKLHNKGQNDLSTDIVGPSVKETSNTLKNPFTR